MFSFVRLFGSTPDGCRGWPSLQAGRCEVLMRLLEAFQRESWHQRKESAKKAVHHWREEIWDAVASSGLYRQTPLPFWRAMEGCIAIGSLATAVHWFVSVTLHEPITCSYNCVIEIGFSWRGKKVFSHTNIVISTQYEWNIERELPFGICAL